MKSPNILFVFCILIRILIVYLVYVLSKPNILSKYTKYIISLPILIIGLSWLIMYIYNLRLNRIDTPEKFGKYKEIGLAITSHVKDLINNSCNKIFVHAIGSDLYGRVISEIFLHDNTNLSDYLLNNKLCKPCSGKRDEWTNEDYKITNDYINSLCKK